jgi:hypothetical protein
VTWSQETVNGSSVSTLAFNSGRAGRAPDRSAQNAVEDAEERLLEGQQIKDTDNLTTWLGLISSFWKLEITEQTEETISWKCDYAENRTVPGQRSR